MIQALRTTIARVRAGVVYSSSRYRVPLAELPEPLFTHWQGTAALEFKGIPRDAFFFARAAEGLMAFFDCARRSGRACGLPSKAADSVWHAWSTLAPADLDRFCSRHFGRPIPHKEGSELALPMALALANTLVAARAIDGQPLAGKHVPRLFSLDRRIGMPDGYAWSAVGGKLAVRSMDWQGRGVGDLTFPPALAPAALLAAALVSQADYEAWIKRSDKGSGCGSGCGSTACDGGDGGGGDGCGGGCGGGD